jgi:RimJ/RimL family protein N-acetyltransferase
MPFRTARLTGRRPERAEIAHYRQVFGEACGAERLVVDIQDWERHEVAPWVLCHAGRPVGVGGFHIGFGDEGLRIGFHFLPEVAGQGLATEFVQGALDHAIARWKEDRFFALVEANNEAALRILGKAGFSEDTIRENPRRLRLRIAPAAGMRAARGA